MPSQDFMDELTQFARSANVLDAPISAYVTNLGMYNEGILKGEYLQFPCTRDDVQACLKAIGVDGLRYEEFFITDYDTPIPGLNSHMGEYESIDELNHLANLIQELDPWDVEKLEAVLDFGEHNSVPDLINLVQNLDNYDLYPGINTQEDLGYYLVDELNALQVPDHLKSYFDYEAYGRDYELDDYGVFSDKGYIRNNGDTFYEYYRDREDIPDEHKVFAYPVPDFITKSKEGQHMSEKAQSTRMGTRRGDPRLDRGSR